MTLIAKNKKALWNYEILKTLQAGIILKGSEVKSIRAKNVNISDSFAKVFHNELYIINMHIAPYKGNVGFFEHNPTDMRKLLLNRKEINALVSKMKEKGYALIPLKIYINDKNLVKLEIGLGKGKKNYDKRAVLKEKEIKKTTDKEIKKWNSL